MMGYTFGNFGIKLWDRASW